MRTYYFNIQVIAWHVQSKQARVISCVISVFVGVITRQQKRDTVVEYRKTPGTAQIF